MQLLYTSPGGRSVVQRWHGWPRAVEWWAYGASSVFPSYRL